MRKPATIKTAIIGEADRLRITGDTYFSSHGRVLAARLDKILGDKTKRYELCKWLSGQASTTNMDGYVVLATLDWLGGRRHENEPPREAKKEVHSCLTEAIEASGIMNMFKTQAKTIPTKEKNVNDKELNEKITGDLFAIPENLRQAEINTGEARLVLKELKRDLADAELNVSFSYTPDGSNAEIRKVQMAKAMADSPEVKAANAAIYAQEMKLITLEAGEKAQYRQFNAAGSLAELQAARLNLMTKLKQH